MEYGARVEIRKCLFPYNPLEISKFLFPGGWGWKMAAISRLQGFQFGLVNLKFQVGPDQFKIGPDFTFCLDII